MTRGGGERPPGTTWWSACLLRSRACLLDRASAGGELVCSPPSRFHLSLTGARAPLCLHLWLRSGLDDGGKVGPFISTTWASVLLLSSLFKGKVVGGCRLASPTSVLFFARSVEVHWDYGAYCAVREQSAVPAADRGGARALREMAPRSHATCAHHPVPFRRCRFFLLVRVFQRLLVLV